MGRLRVHHVQKHCANSGLNPRIQWVVCEAFRSLLSLSSTFVLPSPPRMWQPLFVILVVSILDPKTRHPKVLSALPRLIQWCRCQHDANIAGSPSSRAGVVTEVELSLCYTVPHAQVFVFQCLSLSFIPTRKCDISFALLRPTRRPQV